MDFIAAKQMEADGAVGRVVSPEAFKAFFAESVSRSPALKAQFHRFCGKNGIDKGRPVRIRPDYRYSRVGIQFLGATGTLQAVDPVALYSVGIGGVDPVLGTLDRTDTNVLQGGVQDAKQLFKAYKHGFGIELMSNPTSATVDTQAQILQTLLQNTSAELDTGSQATQKWPPLRSLPGVTVGFQNGGTTPGAVGAAATQGNQSLMNLNPCLYFGASDNYRIQLAIKRQVGPAGAAVPTIPEDPTLEDSVWAIWHMFIGQSFTGIPG